MAAAGRGPPRQRWLSGGVRRRAAHSRPAGSSGERGRAPARGSPWAITATSARSRWRRQSSGLSQAGEAALSTPEAVRPRGSERAPLCRPPHSGAGLILSLSPCSVALQLGVLGRFMRTQAGPPRSFRFGCGGARGCASLTLPGGAAGLGPMPRTLPGSPRVAPHRTHLPRPSNGASCWTPIPSQHHRFQEQRDPPAQAGREQWRLQ